MSKKNLPASNECVLRFIKAICPSSPELYMASFDETTALTDATNLINQLQKERNQLLLANIGLAQESSKLQTDSEGYWKERALRFEECWLVALEKFDKISSWAEAYPLEVFPEPDFKAVRAALESAGLSLDQVSAANMRHVITGVRKIVEGEK